MWIFNPFLINFSLVVQEPDRDPLPAPPQQTNQAFTHPRKGHQQYRKCSPSWNKLLLEHSYMLKWMMPSLFLYSGHCGYALVEWEADSYSAASSWVRCVLSIVQAGEYWVWKNSTSTPLFGKRILSIALHFSQVFLTNFKMRDVATNIDHTKWPHIYLPHHQLAA